MTVTLTPRPSRWDILFSFFSGAECQCSSDSNMIRFFQEV